MEASDLLRASAYSAAQPADERIATMHRALASTDVLVGQLLQRVNSARDAVLVVGPVRKTRRGRADGGGAARHRACSPDCSGRARRSAPATCSSWTSRRPSSTSWAWRSPTRCAGDRSRSRMPARPPLQRRATLVDGTDAARFRAQIAGPGRDALHGVAAAASRSRPRSSSTDRAATTSEAFLPSLALAALGYVLAVYLARLFPFHQLGAPLYWAFLVGFAAGFGVAVWFGARRQVVDAFDHRPGRHRRAARRRRGARKLACSSTVRFGFSPEIAGRFIGFGNVSYALLAAARDPSRRPARPPVGASVGSVGWASPSSWSSLVADGAPFWGADVGGMLTMVPVVRPARGAAAGPVDTCCAPCSWRSVRRSSASPWSPASTCSRPAGSRTHLARLVEQVGSRGVVGAHHRGAPQARHEPVDHHDVALAPARRARDRVRRLPLPATDAPARALVTRIPELRAALVGLVMIGVLGAALNDQGIVVPAVMLGVLVPVLAGLTSVRARPVELTPVRLT